MSGICNVMTILPGVFFLADFGVCRVWGDPHYTTFDDVTYEFQGECEYTLIRDCQTSANFPAIHVRARNWKRQPGDSFSFTGKVTLEFAGTLYTFEPRGQVRIDGVTATLPVRRADGVSISSTGAEVVRVVLGADVLFAEEKREGKNIVCSLAGTGQMLSGHRHLC